MRKPCTVVGAPAARKVAVLLVEVTSRGFADVRNRLLSTVATPMRSVRCIARGRLVLRLRTAPTMRQHKYPTVKRAIRPKQSTSTSPERGIGDVGHKLGETQPRCHIGLQ